MRFSGLRSVKVASGRTGLLLSRPLRTVRESFQLTQLKPFERLVKDAVTTQPSESSPARYSPDAGAHFHARGRTNSFCCRHLLCLVSRLLLFSRGKDQREVCLLAQPGWPVSAPLQSGIRFLPPLLPAFPSDHLAMTFPEKGESTGLPCSAGETSWLRPSLYADRELPPMTGDFETSVPARLENQSASLVL